MEITYKLILILSRKSLSEVSIPKQEAFWEMSLTEEAVFWKKLRYFISNQGVQVALAKR